MRVCMMSTYDLAVPYGGVKHHVHQLAAALERSGDDVTVVGPSSRGALDNVQTFGGVVNVPAKGSQNPAGIFVSPARVAKFFRANRFDVIHIHEPLLPSLSYWSVWLTRDVAHVATFHRFSETESRALGLARKTSG